MLNNEHGLASGGICQTAFETKEFFHWLFEQLFDLAAEIRSPIENIFMDEDQAAFHAAEEMGPTSDSARCTSGASWSIT